MSISRSALLEFAMRVRLRGRVLRGPFAGLRYIGRAHCSAYLPKLFGTYERELHEVVEEIIHLEPATVIDIGAAEGYYAVGLASRLNHAKVIAFELDERARLLIARLASKNGLGARVRVAGACHASDLRRELGRCTAGRTIVICDAEGAEDSLLDPDRVSQLLRNCWLLVETHDFILPGVTERLLDRFSKSHEVCVIPSELRLESDFPSWIRFFLPARYVRWAISEHRPCQMTWLWMRPTLDSCESE